MIVALGPFTCASGKGPVSPLNTVVGVKGVAHTENIVNFQGHFGVVVRAGEVLDAVQFLDARGGWSKWVVGQGGELKRNAACFGMDQRITGFHGLVSDKNIVTIGVHCGKFWRVDGGF